MLDGFAYRGWGPDRLCEYLDDRVRLYGRLISSDELEVAGIFLKDGNIQWLVNAKSDNIYLVSDCSNIFDDIWSERHGGPKADLSHGQGVVLTDARQLIRHDPNQQIGLTPGNHQGIRTPEPFQQGKQVGRNERCTCGSGRKYKKCCGR